MYNKAQIIGHLGQDPDARALPNGDAVSNFSVATSRRWRDKQNGEQKEHTEWHKCAAFGRLAEVCNQWLRKGSQVFIEGELRTRKWEKDGQTHYSTEIVVREMKMLGKAPGDRSNPPAQRGQVPGTQPGGQGAGPSHRPTADDFDDDIPF